METGYFAIGKQKGRMRFWGLGTHKSFGSAVKEAIKQSKAHPHEKLACVISHDVLQTIHAGKINNNVVARGKYFR